MPLTSGVNGVVAVAEPSTFNVNVVFLTYIHSLMLFDGLPKNLVDDILNFLYTRDLDIHAADICHANKAYILSKVYFEICQMQKLVVLMQDAMGRV